MVKVGYGLKPWTWALNLMNLLRKPRHYIHLFNLSLIPVQFTTTLL